MTNKKAKRHLVEFDFEEEGAAVHLVSKKQGGAANGFKTLIKKSNSTKHLPDLEDVSIKKKLEQIKVTMSMEEFLRRFFHIYGEDAELLTAMLGFKTEYEEYSEKVEESESVPMDYASYLADKVSGFEVMKSVNEGNYENVSGADILNILELQQEIENKLLNEEIMDKVSIQKSRFEDLEDKEKELETQIDLVKSLEESKKELEQEIEQIKKAQEEQRIESEITKMKSVLKDLVEEEKIDRISKSLVSMDKEDAEAMIETFQARKSATEDSQLFQETSASGEPEVDEVKIRDMNIEKAYLDSLGIKPDSE